MTFCLHDRTVPDLFGQFHSWTIHSRQFSHPGQVEERGRGIVWSRKKEGNCPGGNNMGGDCAGVDKMTGGDCPGWLK